MKINKKGFTLIELLVTIVIILSILALAVVSITKISDKKKEEAYERVKTTIETAGEQYFEDNKFRFSDLDEYGEAAISLDELVKKDYLSSLTDPRSGKKLAKCNYVKVTKQSGKYAFKFDDHEKCSESNGIVSTYVRQAGAPSFELGFTGNKKNASDWFTGNTYSVLKNIKLNGNGKINLVEYCTGTNCSNFKNSSYTNDISSDTPSIKADKIGETGRGSKSYTYKLTNENNKTAVVMADVYVDETDPIINVNSSYTSSTIPFNVNFSVSDSGSGIDKTEKQLIPLTKFNIVSDYKLIYNNFGPYLSTIRTYDKAGNSAKKNITVIISKPEDEKCQIVSSVTNSNSYGWSKEKPKLDITVTPSTGATVDSVKVDSNNATYEKVNSNIYKYSYTYNGLETDNKKLTVKATDTNGVVCETTNIIKYDNTPPTLDFQDIKSNEKDYVYYDGSTYKWTNKDVTFKVRAEDKYALDKDHTFTTIDGKTVNALFYIEWNEKSGDYSKSETFSECSNNKLCMRQPKTATYDNGAALIAEGKRKEKYTVCDKAGNCTSKEIFANIDKTPPTWSVKVTDSSKHLFSDNNHVFDCLNCTKGTNDACLELKAKRCDKNTLDDNGFEYNKCSDSFGEIDYSEVKWQYKNDGKKVVAGNYFTGNTFYKLKDGKWIDDDGTKHDISFSNVDAGTHINYQLKCRDKAGNISETIKADLTVTNHYNCYGAVKNLSKGNFYIFNNNKWTIDNSGRCTN